MDSFTKTSLGMESVKAGQNTNSNIRDEGMGTIEDSIKQANPNEVLSKLGF